MSVRRGWFFASVARISHRHDRKLSEARGVLQSEPTVPFSPPSCISRSLRQSVSLLLTLGLSISVSLLSCRPAAALTYNFTAVGNLADMIAGNQGVIQQTLGNQVAQGFQDAGDMWSNLLSDPVTANVDIDFRNDLGAGVLGATNNITASGSYSAVRLALIADALSADDATAVANLQPGAGLEFLTNRRSDGAVIRANNTDAYANVLDVPRLNLKALGLIAGNDASTDGEISFSSLFSWDFDHTNPITPGFDFVGVAAHELGHLMGYFSGVDIVDLISNPNGPFKNTDLNGGLPGIGDATTFRVFSVLDLYRYSAASLAASSQPSSGAVLDLAYGDTPYFSLNAGATNLGRFSTGSSNGDGRQASHWQDSLGLRLMDPTAASGEFLTISNLDIRSMDAIGWNLASLAVPEPSTLALAAAGLVVALVIGRTKKRWCGG